MSGGFEEEDDLYEDLYARFYPGRCLRTCQLEGLWPRIRDDGSVRQRAKYTVDVLDAKDGTEIEAACRVFLVPPQRAEEWLFTSIDGQWQVVVDSKASRLILITQEGNEDILEIAHMQKDVADLVPKFVPVVCRSIGEIEYLTQENSIKARRLLSLVNSAKTGAMLVEDVAIPSKRTKSRKLGRADARYYRRLCFRRNPNMIQSEALLMREGVARKCKVSSEATVFEGLKVDHSALTNDYHAGMVVAFVLILNNLEQWLASKEEIRVMILGLGAGLLPMFIHNHIPVDDIQVVELDELVCKIAKDHFGFVENEKMKLQIGDGVLAVKILASLPSNVSRLSYPTRNVGRLHVLFVDTDSSDPSNGLSCPAPEFLEDSFLMAGRESLHDGGMLIVNVVASSRHYHVYSKMQLKKFFPDVYEIEVDKDVNRVLIAMAQPRPFREMGTNMKDLEQFKRICKKFAPWGHGPNFQECAKGLKRVD